MRAAFGKRMQPALSFSPRLQCVSQGALQRQRGDDVMAPKRLLVFPRERSNAKGAMMSFAPKRLLVFPEERSNAKRAMMSFVPKRPDVFPWERLLYQLDGDATCVVAGPVGFGSRFLVAWEAASRGWRRCCGGLAKRVSGCLENCFGGGGMRLSGPGRGARLRSD